MRRIFDITAKDLLQILRDGKTFMFLLIMPIAFTFLFGFAFGSIGSSSADPRLPVGFLDEDDSWLSRSLYDGLNSSQVIRLEKGDSQAALEARVADEKLAGAIIIPPGYGHLMLRGEIARLILVADTGASTGRTVESEALTTAIRLENALRTAIALEEVAGDRVSFDYTFDQALEAWRDPPVRVSETTSSVLQQQKNSKPGLAHNSPGMMLQFAIAGLMTSAALIVAERKNRSLQRLLTTNTARVHILLGHYLAIFVLICGQFLVLILFGQVILRVGYLRDPAATFLVAFCAALCISALGLLVGVMAKSEEQALMFSLIPMFVFAGLGGAWVPLEVTGPVFQAIGHITPVAWAMDGFKNILLRGQGVESALLPSAALGGYAVLFFALATWRFYTSEER